MRSCAVALGLLAGQPAQYAPVVAPIPAMLPVATQQITVTVNVSVPVAPMAQAPPEPLPVATEPPRDMGPVEQSLRNRFPAHAHLWEEEELLVKIAEAFDLLDLNDDKKIQLNEFKRAITRLQIHEPKGSAEGWKDDAFNKFDVDGKGEIE